MSARWWLGVTPAETSIRCGPNHHRLVWREGVVVPVDHSDPAGEAVLVSLGGKEPACLAILRHWRDHAADPRLLVLGGRHPGDTVVVGSEDLDRARNDLLAAAGALPGPAGRDWEPEPGVAVAERYLGLLELLALDPAVQRRLQLEVATNLADLASGPATSDRDDPSGDSGPALAAGSAWAVLEAATVGRLTPVVRRWAATPSVEIAIGSPAGVVVGRQAGVSPGAGYRTMVTVGPGWLGEVWGRYLAAVDGFLVLEVHRIVEDRAEVTGLANPEGEPARLLVRGPAPWRVEQRLDRT